MKGLNMPTSNDDQPAFIASWVRMFDQPVLSGIECGTGRDPYTSMFAATIALYGYMFLVLRQFFHSLPHVHNTVVDQRRGNTCTIRRPRKCTDDATNKHRPVNMPLIGIEPLAGPSVPDLHLPLTIAGSDTFAIRRPS